jgi:transketolase
MQLTRPQLAEMAKEIRKTILIMINRAGFGHVGGSLSEVEILAALYFSVMDIDPKNPLWEKRDRFILSKGHASAGFYATLAHRGYFPIDMLDTFDQVDSKLQAHPDMHKCPGVDFSTGSLGQGLSVGIGIAEGARMRQRSFRTFVLIGDGETQEGQVWEAVMYAGVRKVKNLIAIIDNNRVQLSSKTKDNIDPMPYKEKFQAFHWQVVTANGHDFDSLVPALRAALAMSKQGPVAVVADTVKGKGVSFMEGKFTWHGNVPNNEQLTAALKEIEEG